MLSDADVEKVLDVVGAWYESHRSKKGNVNTNVMTGGIAVAELLRTQFPLTEDNIKSANGSQVKGLSGTLAKRVLQQHGETRKFTSEGGRTSRGTVVLAGELAVALTDALLPFDPNEEDRNKIADALQHFFVSCVRADYFGKQKLDVDIDCNKPVALLVDDILAVARNRADKPAGIVAQHLVGAKLELRFPDLEVGRDSANAADLQTQRQGDFQLGNTAFHVTVAPSVKLADRARENLSNGFRPIVLVTASSVSFAFGLFEAEGIGKYVNVQSIESFVGTNVEEMGSYQSEDIRLGVAKLIRRYNERITACEVDQSLRIKEPAWMVDLLDVTYSSVPY